MWGTRCAPSFAAWLANSSSSPLLPWPQPDEIFSLVLSEPGGDAALDSAARAEVTITPSARPAAAKRCATKRATIVGTARRDVLRGTRRADVIAALAGNDRIEGLRGNDLICGGAGKDRLIGGRGRDRCLGGKGRDTATCERERSA